MVGWLLSAVVALGLVAVGAAALLAPRVASTQYGIVVDDPRALSFVRAMGIRDVVIGVLLGLLVDVRAREALAWAMFAAAAIAVVDLAVVVRDRRRAPSADRFGGRGIHPGMLHATGGAALVAAGVVLRAGW